jgi:hypothetical protein
MWANYQNFLSFPWRRISFDVYGDPLSNLLVECFTIDSETSDNYVGNTITDSRGQFELRFNYESLERNFGVNLMSGEISEAKGSPDVYIVVSDSNRALYRRNTFSNPAETENFDVIIKEELSFSDPYANSFQREISLILSNVTREVVDLSQVDPVRAAQQMIRIFGNLLYYNVQGVQLHGYPGPQVPRYPKRFPHDHSLPWNQKTKRYDGLSILKW